ncbi:MAG TPA: response regulator [Gemmataceae bacterium]|nr:response regulator [Gemmataceae bacterium]
MNETQRFGTTRSPEPCRILIVDDCAEDREVYRRAILGSPSSPEESGYKIWEASCGEDGFQLLAEAKPDCILLDYRLPDMDGLEFLDRLQASGEEPAAVVVLTGQGDEAIAVQAMRKGAQDYLVKGLGSAELRQAMRSAIDRGILRRTVESQHRRLEKMSAEQAKLIEQLRDRTAALVEANRNKDEFVAMLAHELRNPLAPIRDGLYVLQTSSATDTSSIRAMIERQVDNLVRLVDDLLDVSRMTQKKIRIMREPVDVSVVLKHAAEACRQQLADRKIHLQTVVPREPLWVSGDAVRLEQVFVNLLSNAVKFTPTEGTVRLAAERDGDSAVLKVRDNGIGIDRDALPRVFDMFMQVDHSLARTQGGLGVGLTLVRMLVQLHGGVVEACSEGLGTGTEFVIRLPIAADAAGPVGLSAIRANDRSLRVLVVDDNEDAAQALGMLLELSSFGVRVATDGLAALEIAERFEPHVALVDLGMPGIDGFELGRRLRSNFNDLLLVAVTGYSQPEDKRRSREAGFDHHLVKPVDWSALQTIFAGYDSDRLRRDRQFEKVEGA